MTVGRPGAPESMPADAREAILAWYDVHGRRLPFRATSDPWAVLVSEAMAQQTQAARAGEAWVLFMARFPSVSAVAAAPTAEIVRAWQGLGYNRRAVNLQRAARRIVEDFGGVVPSDPASLESLPGVGPYTARAVAAIAFGRPVGPVDTNVRRVLSRMAFGESVPATSPRDLQRLADAVVPPDRPGDWTHAVMDLGATICHPRRPACDACPARRWCRYRAEGASETDARSARPGRAVHGPTPPFPTTNRWLRGRIVDRLRDAPPEAWVSLGGSIGDHDPTAVTAAAHRLAAEGLIELAAADDEALLARLSVG